jgi:hypothetical protein
LGRIDVPRRADVELHDPAAPCVLPREKAEQLSLVAFGLRLGDGRAGQSLFEGRLGLPPFSRGMRSSPWWSCGSRGRQSLHAADKLGLQAVKVPDVLPEAADIVPKPGPPILRPCRAARRAGPRRPSPAAPGGGAGRRPGRRWCR